MSIPIMKNLMKNDQTWLCLVCLLVLSGQAADFPRYSVILEHAPFALPQPPSVLEKEESTSLPLPIPLTPEQDAVGARWNSSPARLKIDP